MARADTKDQIVVLRLLGYRVSDHPDRPGEYIVSLGSNDSWAKAEPLFKYNREEDDGKRA